MDDVTVHIRRPFDMLGDALAEVRKLRETLRKTYEEPVRGG